MFGFAFAPLMTVMYDATSPWELVKNIFDQIYKGVKVPVVVIAATVLAVELIKMFFFHDPQSVRQSKSSIIIICIALIGIFVAQNLMDWLKSLTEQVAPGTTDGTSALIDSLRMLL